MRHSPGTFNRVLRIRLLKSNTYISLPHISTYSALGAPIGYPTRMTQPKSDPDCGRRYERLKNSSRSQIYSSSHLPPAEDRHLLGLI
jgi:hypothetical protein